MDGHAIIAELNTDPDLPVVCVTDDGDVYEVTDMGYDAALHSKVLHVKSREAVEAEAEEAEVEAEADVEDTEDEDEDEESEDGAEE